MKTSQKVPPVTSPSDVEEFLRKERDFTYPSSDSPFCVKFGIFRKSLLDCGKECGKVQKAAEKEQQKRDISQKIIAQGGVCQNPADVHRLISVCRSMTAKRAALQIQIQYHVHVLESSSPLLVIGKKDVDNIVGNLCQYLEGNQCPQPPPGFNANELVDVDNDGAAAHPTNQQLYADSDTDTSDSSDTEPQRKRPRQEKKLFENQGSTVAIYYDNDFYVGDVLTVHDDGTEANVTFMTRVRDKNVFLWPDHEDIHKIHSMFVCAWDVQTRTTNGRTWIVQNLDDIEAAYDKMKNS
eukprot:TRINITY_DN43617_c5_g2_i2.p1 TRINITY_DN43617_c5_g2~~TRINITY_DN43617_c5_g2_i2.p1  ORF type:complete len:295 (+),score=76.42 TRINITY_DN43617_c5_g2_i2:757-1641(+)